MIINRTLLLNMTLVTALGQVPFLWQVVRRPRSSEPIQKNHAVEVVLIRC